MAILLNRIYCGNYNVSLNTLKNKKIADVRRMLQFLTILTGNQGFGQIKGTTKKVGANYSHVSVCVFKRSNRQLLWETTSKADGSYAFRNIAVGLECFVVAFDPNNQYNAVIQDKVIAK